MVLMEKRSFTHSAPFAPLKRLVKNGNLKALTEHVAFPDMTGCNLNLARR